MHSKTKLNDTNLLYRTFELYLVKNLIYLLGGVSIANPYDFNIAHEKIVGFC